MERFMEKYSFWFTTVIGVDALVVLIFNWNTIDMVQKLPIMYIVALALHEGEELKLPGGFVELVTTITGIKIKNIGLAKFGLLLFTLWATIIPAFLASYIWPVMATLFIGVIEIFAHLAAARVNSKNFYSPGMITAICVQFPIAVYGFYYIVSNGMVKWIYWIWALVFLLVPMFGLQAVIVRSNGQKWLEFVNGARKAMLTKEGRKKAKDKK